MSQGAPGPLQRLPGVVAGDTRPNEVSATLASFPLVLAAPPAVADSA
jgi:hypothetical protein